MKKLIILPIIAAVLFSCGKVDDIYYGKVVDPNEGGSPDDSKIDWSAAADYATTTLIDNFWRSPDNGFIGSKPNYHFTNGVKGEVDESNNYWPQAHAMDVIIDAYLRAEKAGDTEAANKYAKMFYDGYEEPIGDGSSKSGRGVLWTSYGGDPRDTDISKCFGNPFIDDMEWHALTMIRLYEATSKPIYLKEAQKLYAQVFKAWDLPDLRDFGGSGGFLWSYSADPSKNACSNGPGCLTAIRLHEMSLKDNYAADSDPAYVNFDYLANAEMTYAWISSVLFNKITGMVYSGISRNEGLHTAFTLTYDQGTFMGAAHLLYKYTDKKTYLDDATKAAIYTITDSGISQGGLLRDEGPGDGALFKGIFIRYVTRLINDKDLDIAKRIQLYDFIKGNAITLWTKGLVRDEEGNPTGIFTPDWGMTQEQVRDKGAEYREPNLGWQTSGSTMIEAMNVLKDPRTNK